MHTVGTSTRLRTEDVHAALRGHRERAAFAALIELKGYEERPTQFAERVRIRRHSWL